MQLKTVIASLENEYKKLAFVEPVSKSGVAELDTDAYKRVLKKDTDYECCVTRAFLPELCLAHETVLPNWGSIVRFLLALCMTQKESFVLSWFPAAKPNLSCVTAEAWRNSGGTMEHAGAQRLLGSQFRSAQRRPAVRLQKECSRFSATTATSRPLTMLSARP